MIEFGILCLLIASSIAVISVSGALATRIVRRDDEDASRYCRECKKVHPTLSEELGAHGDPGS